MGSFSYICYLHIIHTSSSAAAAAPARSRIPNLRHSPARRDRSGKGSPPATPLVPVQVHNPPSPLVSWLRMPITENAVLVSLSSSSSASLRPSRRNKGINPTHSMTSRCIRAPNKQNNIRCSTVHTGAGSPGLSSSTAAQQQQQETLPLSDCPCYYIRHTLYYIPVRVVNYLLGYIHGVPHTCVPAPATTTTTTTSSAERSLVHAEPFNLSLACRFFDGCMVDGCSGLWAGTR